MKGHSRLPSPALVVASLALIVALGGTSYAAFKLPKNSVGSKQLRKNAVTSAKIKNGSLRTADFKAGDAPQAQGYAGRASSILVDTYDKVIVTKDLPKGNYILSATVDARGFGAPTGYMGGISIIDCTIPGYHTASYYLKADDTYISEQKSLSLHSGVVHPGGPVSLICSRTWNSVYIDEAGLTAVKVDSLG